MTVEVHRAVASTLHWRLFRRNILTALVCYGLFWMVYSYTEQWRWLHNPASIVWGTFMLVLFCAVNNPEAIEETNSPQNQWWSLILPLGFLSAILIAMLELDLPTKKWIIASVLSVALLLRCIQMHCKLRTLLEFDALDFNWFKLFKLGSYSVTDASALIWLANYEVHTSRHQHVPIILVNEKIRLLFEEYLPALNLTKHPEHIYDIDKELFHRWCNRYRPFKENFLWHTINQLTDDPRVAYIQWLQQKEATFNEVQADFQNFAPL